MPNNTNYHPIDDQQPEQNTLIIENEALRRGFTIIPNYILRNPSLSFGARMTYTLLLSYAWQEGSCFPGQEKLAFDLGVTRKAVNTYLHELKEKRFVDWKRRGMGKTNVYRILDVQAEEAPTPSLKSDVTPRLHQDVTPRLHHFWAKAKAVLLSEHRGCDTRSSSPSLSASSQQTTSL